MTIDVLMQMLHYAKRLRKLTLFLHDDDGGDMVATDFNINSDHFKTILDSIKNRPGSIVLCIDIFSSKIKLDVPEEMSKENSDFLSIKIRQDV